MSRYHDPQLQLFVSSLFAEIKHLQILMFKHPFHCYCLAVKGCVKNLPDLKIRTGIVRVGLNLAGDLMTLIDIFKTLHVVAGLFFVVITFQKNLLHLMFTDSKALIHRALVFRR